MEASSVEDEMEEMIRLSRGLSRMLSESFLAALLLCFVLAPSEVSAEKRKASELLSLSLEELMLYTVTTQKKEESLLTVPVAVSSITEEEIRRWRVYDMSRLNFSVPGFQFGRSGSDARPTIRGVSTRQIEANGDPSIGFFLDNVYQSRTSQGLLPFVDLERVEVQRGPQGTFFGRNTMGGNINVISKKPTTEYASSFNSELGNYDLVRVDGYLNAPLSSEVQTRLAYLFEDRAGYIENLQREGSVQDQHQGFLRGTISMSPLRDLKVLLRGTYWKQGGSGAGTWGSSVKGTLRDPVTGMRSIYGEVDRENPRVALDVDGDGRNDRAPNPTDPQKVRMNRSPSRSGEQKMVDAEARYVLPFGVVKSVTAFTDFLADRSLDVDFTELDKQFESLNTRSRTFSQETHISSTTSTPIDWIFGLFFLEEDQEQLWDLDNIESPSTGIVSTTKATTRSMAGFGQLSYEMADSLRWTLGGRYTRDDREYTNFKNPNWGGTSASFNSKGEFSKPTAKVGVDYSWNGSMIYASYSTGFKSGGFNEVIDAPTFESEEAKAYEVGFKTAQFDNKLLLNVSAFHNEYDDLQIQSFDPATRKTFFTNAGEASAHGVEAELAFRPTHHLSVSAMMAFIDAKYDRFENSPNPFELERAREEFTIDLSGNKIERAPEWKASLRMAYSIELESLGTLTPSVSTSYTGDYYTTQFNTPIDRQKAYTISDANLRWLDISKKWSLVAFVNNIEDEVILENGVFGGSDALFANYGPPRTYGIRFSYHFSP